MRMRILQILLLVCSISVCQIYGADHNTFKDCARIEYCNRLRGKALNNLYVYDGYYTKVSDGKFYMVLKPATNDSREAITIQIDAIQNEDTFRVRVYETDTPSRYELENVLNGTLKNIPFDQMTSDNASVSMDVGDNSVLFLEDPFQVQFIKNDVVVLFLNLESLVLENTNSSQAYAFEVNFPLATQAYGIHEHADNIALQNTSIGGVDPYRLRNLDVAGYELNSPMSLYGSIPVIYGHGPDHTSGIFLHNAAEQWYDIKNSEDDDGTNVFIMGESGLLDLFVLMGPTPQKVVRQYVKLTGTAHLPQLWTLGYHQCRWNYNSQEDVKDVVANFGNFDFPLDAIWLDIEYTNGKRYFTWDPTHFSDPVEMQQNISAVNKRLVTIIDPHIKVDPDYSVYSEALELDLYVKNADGSVFEGNCWPGLSSYIDFLNPDGRTYIASKYSFKNFEKSTPTLAGIWNDMNEPSVFDDSLEKTLPGDAIHFGGVKHRDIHNIYGLLHTMATHKGLLDRDGGQKRPFILTRSHFSGSQRFTAFWTGDNTAEWGHLAISYAECLNANILGFVFCGADIGGFFNNPGVELLQRWYQAGVWLPFYRAHANLGTKRREPYLFDESVQKVIRDAIKLRYKHIPVWYTLFYEHTRNGDPIIRPLFYQYPAEKDAFNIDDQLLLGTDILVKAITEPEVTSVSVYFPGRSEELWFSLDTDDIFPGEGFKDINVDLNSIPVYYRAGSVIARKNTERLSTQEMSDDGYTLYVNLPQDNEAHGTLYIDDNTSFDYRENKTYLYVSFDYDSSSSNLTMTVIDEDANSDDFSLNIDAIVVNAITKLPENGNPGTYERNIIKKDVHGQLLSGITLKTNHQLILPKF